MILRILILWQSFILFFLLLPFCMKVSLTQTLIELAVGHFAAIERCVAATDASVSLHHVFSFSRSCVSCL